MLSWLRSYLTDRTQFVVIDDHSSEYSGLSYGVPQGSVLGPLLFILYTKPLSDLIKTHSVESQSFADDTQLYDTASHMNIDSSLLALSSCISDIKIWMLENKLKLNDDKTEAIIICSPSNVLQKQKPKSMSICNSQIEFSTSVRDLGFLVTENTSLDQHISNICRSAYCELRRISSVRHLLSVDATKTLVSSFVLSKFDYCNALLSGCPQYLLDKLQKVQNSAARVVLRSSKRDHVRPLLISLHWLPIRARIDYKLSTLCHSFFSHTSPVYISTLLSVYSPSRQLRSSSDSRVFVVPKVRTKAFGHRTFSYAAPTVWNSLPYEIRHLQTTSSFKSALKTFLFRKYHNLS